MKIIIENEIVLCIEISVLFHLTFGENINEEHEPAGYFKLNN
jgi:hypothetical protein